LIFALAKCRKLSRWRSDAILCLIFALAKSANCRAGDLMRSSVTPLFDFRAGEIRKLSRWRSDAILCRDGGLARRSRFFPLICD
jgi:hypothetical protein